MPALAPVMTMTFGDDDGILRSSSVVVDHSWDHHAVAGIVPIGKALAR
jgi:hypothetical protein